MDAVIAKPDLTTGPPAQNAELDQLTTSIAATDAAASGAANTAMPSAPAAPAINYAHEAEAMTEMLAALITGYEPRTIAIWDKERKACVAAAVAPVMEKYNFTVGAIPPEIILIVVAGPPLYQSSKIIAEGMKPRQLTQPQQGASAASDALVVQGQESGTVTHSEAMMQLST